jgi:hypothetical protein
MIMVPVTVHQIFVCELPKIAKHQFLNLSNLKLHATVLLSHLALRVELDQLLVYLKDRWVERKNGSELVDSLFLWNKELKRT